MMLQRMSWRQRTIFRGSSPGYRVRVCRSCRSPVISQLSYSLYKIEIDRSQRWHTTFGARIVSCIFPVDRIRVSSTGYMLFLSNNSVVGGTHQIRLVSIFRGERPSRLVTYRCRTHLILKALPALAGTPMRKRRDSGYAATVSKASHHNFTAITGTRSSRRT